MLVLRFWYLLAGWVRVEVKGMRSERFINLAAVRGIYLWGIKRVDTHVIRFNVGIEGYKALKKIAHISSCSMKINAKLGLPFLVDAVCRRRFMVYGAMLCLFTIYVLSTYIWFIQIDGGKTSTAEMDRTITRILEKYNVHLGVRKAQFDQTYLTRKLLLEVPELAWASIDVRGTLLRVDYIKKIVPKKDNFTESNIVAEKPGVITKIIVLDGIARVNEGDAVEQGDILIEGIGPSKYETRINPETKVEENIEIPGPSIRAKGIVEALVDYEGYSEWPTKKVIVKRTGNKRSLYMLLFRNNMINLYRTGNKFTEYEVKTKRVFDARWRNLSLPVEIYRMDFYETLTRTYRYSVAEARSRARALAFKAAAERIPRDAAIVSRKSFIVDLGDSSASSDAPIIRMRALITAREAVGLEKRR